MADRIEIVISAEDQASGATNAEAQALDNLAASGKTATASSEGTTSALGGLAGALSAVGIAVSADAILKEAIALDELGASSLRAENALNTLSGGRSDEYMQALGDATNGVVDHMDGARIASEQLSLGLVHTSEESAQLSRAAMILGESFGNKGAAQAIEDFDMMLSRGTTRGLYQYGISLTELRAKVEELKQSHADMSEQELNSMAMQEIAIDKAGKMTDVLNDEKAHIDQLKDAWSDYTEERGKGLAQALDPMIMGATNMLAGKQPADALAASNAALTSQIAASTSTWNGYVDALRAANFNTQLGREGMARLHDQFVQQREDYQAANTAARNQEEQLARMANAQDKTTGSLQLSDDEYKKALDDIALYDQELEAQSAATLRAEQSMKSLTQIGGNQEKMFNFSIQQMGNMKLSASQLEAAYNSLGLATGQVTHAEIIQGQTLAGVNNLMGGGKISAEAYIQSLTQIPKATTQASAALVIMQAAAEGAGQAAKNMGAYMAATSMAVGSSLDNTLHGTSDSASEVQSKLDKLAGSKTPINMDAAQVKAAQGEIDKVQSLLDNLKSKTIDVTVNYTTNGAPPGVP